ncbi:Metallo-dependent hydrolase [Cucurbitaria berberidis CBS 394.84]|uniref:Metallo-dependent hydrolase n=1 Tax=Cucurbitaria berberidis CBS 394.84 TaxID=1168544 RepID=A0A9P4GT81_9PLEO|nr:Metallo-dependent hydrolase [Cucurbitaria berberidis CBS 394.84]KAF1851372.1 Metallo-dependent hydrolase [Cucurbitaria berberidis CBS 394.84]
MSSTSTLLQGGIALVHDTNDHVVPTKTSILIENGKIAKIAQNIAAPEGTVIIDCTDKIISPGFIDTHHHGWQTQLKGRHANEQLLEYMVTGNSQHYQYSSEDVFYGQLAGMLEGIAAGTTTVVDHAHITVSPDHVRLAIAATASSGIRSVFCYTPMMRVKQFNLLGYHSNIFEDWVMQTFNEIADHGPFGTGRVTLGFAFDSFFLPAEMIKDIFAQVKAKGVKTITCHGSVILGKSVVQNLASLDLLDESIIISHGGTLKKADAELVKAAGAFISSTPSTELQMAMGRPYCFDASFQDGGVSGDSVGFQDNGSLGVDCHSCTAGSIISEAKLGLQNARNHFNEFHMKQGKIPRTLPQNLRVESAFNLATIKGAEAANLSHEIGRIAEGYDADLVIFDSFSPSMVGAAQHDPVAAIILHSSPADIDTVIVGGVVRKRDFKLLPVPLEGCAKKTAGQDVLGWNSIANEVVTSREKMQKEIDKIDFKEAKGTLIKLFHIDESKFVNV